MLFVGLVCDVVCVFVFAVDVVLLSVCVVVCLCVVCVFVCVR